MSDSLLPSTAKSNRNKLWNHCIDYILVLDADDVKLLKKGGIKRMQYFYQYCANINNFNDRFPDNSPTIINIRYFIMNCHLNDYTSHSKELLQQDEETFGALNYIEFES